MPSPRLDQVGESDWRGLVAALLVRVQSELHETLPLVVDLDRSVAPGLNPPGWLVWHLTRSTDRNVSEIAGVEQCWLADRWHERFGRPADPSDTGYEQSAAEVTGFRSPGATTLLAYHDEVVAMALAYLRTAPVGDLARFAPSPTLGTNHTVGERLVGVLNESFQHLGQARLSA